MQRIDKMFVIVCTAIQPYRWPSFNSHFILSSVKQFDIRLLLAAVFLFRFHFILYLCVAFAMRSRNV